MNIVVYIIRFLLAFLFIYAGIEKLFLPYDPSVFRTDAAEADPVFFTYYELLQGSGYLYFVGFFQLLCGTLLIFKRTYLLGSIMLVPLILCLLMTHVFFSKYPVFIIFDSVIFSLNLVLLFQRFKDWRPMLFKEQNSWI
ncbi:MAG: MauE/DoxX family redox-associated membrane protein [Bacteroidota bacterium]|nr:MauE/DoxX family redox-associated membrane protein [uncultured Allomuricauda sp.]